uniref:RNA binding motif protein 41 n=1 Tax=Acanthochromis polyacanthus TaxID=80966 RepID=A0A3Q1FWT6_9TELE
MVPSILPHRCVAKRQCFAPAALYRPFGEQAAGVRSLSQFQALQDGEKELASLRELGLTDAEIQLWQSRDVPEPNGVCAAPGAKQQRLQVIRDKIEARAELLSRPQRFAASRPMSRREMEIEQALFQGNDRLGFLTALYHRGTEGLRAVNYTVFPTCIDRTCDLSYLSDEENQESQQGASSSDPMDSLYRDVLRSEKRASLQNSEGESPAASHLDTHRTSGSEDSEQQDSEDRPEPRPAAAAHINMSHLIGRLTGPATPGRPLTVRGDIQTITDEEILKNRESEEEIRNIPRFRSYQRGKPSKVQQRQRRCYCDNPDGYLVRLRLSLQGVGFLAIPSLIVAPKIKFLACIHTKNTRVLSSSPSSSSSSPSPLPSLSPSLPSSSPSPSSSSSSIQSSS